MRPKNLDFDPADVDTDGFGDGVTGATFTLLANDSGDGLAHQVSILNNTATDHSGKTMALVGTDADGKSQTETIAGPAGSATVESTKYFKTLLSVTPSATIGADTFDIGWVDEFASQTIPLDFYREHAPLVGLQITGTISLDVQLTNNNPFEVGITNLKRVPLEFQLEAQDDMLWVDDDNLAAVTADAHGSLSDWPVKAIRIIANSYTNGAEVQATLSQAH